MNMLLAADWPLHAVLLRKVPPFTRKGFHTDLKIRQLNAKLTKFGDQFLLHYFDLNGEGLGAYPGRCTSIATPSGMTSKIGQKTI